MKSFLNIEDENGNVVKQEEYGAGNAEVDKAFNESVQSGKPGEVYFYQDEKGETQYTFDQNAVPSKVSLNPETKNIDIIAPQSFLDSDMYKESVKPKLEAISLNYKLNPDYQYALLQDDTTTKSSEDWVKDINDELPVMVEQRVAMDNEEERIYQESGVRLNDEQLIKMSTVAIEQKDEQGNIVQKVNDDTVQMMPEYIKNMNAFKNMQGWDANTHGVSNKDLKEAWNLDKISDEDVHEVHDAVEDYFAKGDFSNADEYAEMVAFSQWLDHTDPEMGFWRSVGENVEAAFDGAFHGFGEYLTEIGEGVNALFEGYMVLTDSDPNDQAQFASPEFNKDAREKRESVQKYNEELIKERAEISDSAATIYAVSKEVAPIAVTWFIGNKIAAVAQLKTLGAVQKIATGMKGTQQVTEAVNAARGAIALGKSAEAQGKLASAAAASGMAMSVMLNTVSTAKMVSTISRAIKVASAAPKVANVAAALSEITVDVALTDPTVLSRFMTSNAKNEDKAYLLEQIAGNVVPWTALTVGGKIMKKVGETSAGQVANAIVRKQVNKWSARFGQAIDNAKTVIHHGDADFNLTKAEKLADKGENKLANAKFMPVTRQRHNYNRQVAALKRQQNVMSRRVYRDAEREIGDTKIFMNGWDDVVEDAKTFNRKADNITSSAWMVEASLMYGQDVGYKVQQMMAENPLLKNGRDEYVSQLTRVLEAEKKAGIKASSKEIDLGFGTVRLMSKASNEYVYGMYRLQLARHAEPIMKKAGESTKGLEKEVAYYTKATAEFAEKNPELAAELDNLLVKAKKFSGATQDVAVAEKVKPASELAAQRNSKVFKEGYVRSQRVSDWAKKEDDVAEVKAADLRGKQHIEWGFKGDAPKEYQDMTLILFDDLSQVAKKATRRQTIEALKGLGQKVEIATSGAEKEAAEEIGYSKNKIVPTVQYTTKQSVKNLPDSFFTVLFKNKTEKSDVVTATRRAAKAADRVAEAESTFVIEGLSSRRAFNELRRVFGDDLGQVAAEVVLEKIGKPLNELTVEEWGEFINRAPAAVKKQLKEILEEHHNSSPWNGIIKADLPKIKTSDYLARNGLSSIDDVPKYMHPFLSESKGVPMDDVLNGLSGTIGTRVGDERAFQSLVGSINDATVQSQNPAEIIEDIYRYVAGGKNGMKLDGENLVRAFANSDEATEGKLFYSMLASNMDDIFDFNGGMLREAAGEVKRARMIEDLKTIYSKDVKALKKVIKETGVKDPEIADLDMPEILNAVDDAIDGIVEANAASPKVIKGLEAFGGDDDLVEYVTLSSLTDKSNLRAFKKKLRDKAVKEYTTRLTAKYTIEKNGKKVVTMSDKKIKKLANTMAHQTAEVFETRLDQRFGDIAKTLIDRGNDAAVTDMIYNDFYAKVGQLNDEIALYKKTPEIVKTYDDMGREEYVRLSPAIADMITTMPGELRRSTFGELQNMMVQSFRMGTTGGLIVPSLIRQGFRDTMQAFGLGNATRTSKMSTDMLADDLANGIFGDTVYEYYKQYMPDVWGQLVRESEETGTDIGVLVARNEAAIGEAGTEMQLQSRLYDFGRQARIAKGTDGEYSQTVLDRISGGFEKWFNKTETLNNIREKGVRKAVYSEALNKALKNGHSLPEARNYARMMQAEVSTNFARQSYHFANLTRTVPYLGAAINGSKSFWRMYALDPVGVTTRIIGGFVVPTISLTVLSLSNEDDARIYKQIPEYEKDDNFILVLNGQKIAIPIPQEISNIVRPLQSMVEVMHGANDHSFEELMANNLLGFASYDLQGFVNIDGDRLLINDFNEDPVGNIMQSHIIPGVSMVASQMLPPLVKSGVMWATGYDPYTRRPINTAYELIDPETGQNVIMDYKSGELAKGISNIFQGNLGMSAQMAQTMLNNIFGTGNMDIIDGLSDLAASVGENDLKGGAESVAKRWGGKAMGVVFKPNYGEESNTAWNRAVSALYKEKEAMMADGTYQKYIDALDNKNYGWGSDEAYNTAKSYVTTKQQEYQLKVLKVAKNLVNNYDGGTLDSVKFAAIISLMNLEDRPGDRNTNAAEEIRDKDEYFMNQAKAVETMQRLGFDSPNDYSIFGYYKKNEDGTITKEFYTPLSILNYQGNADQQNDIAVANITNAVNDAGLWAKRTAIKEQADAIYDADTVDYDKLDEMAVQWNAEVAKTVAPYVNKMTPEAAINNPEVSTYLRGLIMVPPSWKVNDKGRHPSLGSRGNGEDAYYDSWLKKMFSVNDQYKGQY